MMERILSFIPAVTWEDPGEPSGNGFFPILGRRAGSEVQRPSGRRSLHSADSPPAPGSPGCSDLKHDAIVFQLKSQTNQVQHTKIFVRLGVLKMVPLILVAESLSSPISDRQLNLALLEPRPGR